MPTIKWIAIFNPPNGTFVLSIDYKFPPHSTSGSHFGYKYQPGTFIYWLDESTTIFTPKFTLESEVLVHSHSPPYCAKIIGLPTYDRPNIYTVLFANGSISEYSDTNNLLEAIPTLPPNPYKHLELPHWIQSGVNATLFLSTMSKPRHGKLFLDPMNQWIFCAGQNTELSRGILLEDFTRNCQELLDTG